MEIMDDKQISARIGELITEEHTLEGDDEPDATRLRELAVELDQCWDLLRQRRALRDAGLNPDEAHARSTKVVEDYRQ